MLTEDKLDTLDHLHRCQLFILASSAMDMNMSEIEKNAEQRTNLLKRYKEQVPGFAESYFSFEMDEFGGGKGTSWLNGKDLDWFQKRLLKKSNKDSESNNVDGQYLINQWKTVFRPEMDIECMPAFNEVTCNGKNVEISGGNIWILLDRIRQMWYEKHMQRVSKKAAEDVKKSNTDFWQKREPLQQSSAAECPLTLTGHCPDCKYGRNPIYWPKGWLVFYHMGPLADQVREAVEATLDAKCKASLFPPFKSAPAFALMFTSNKTQYVCVCMLLQCVW